MDASCRVCGMVTALPDLEVRGHVVDFVCVRCGAPHDATQAGAGVPARENRAGADRAAPPSRGAPDGERGATRPPEPSEAAPPKGDDERLLDLRRLAALRRTPGAEARSAADLIDAPQSVRTAIRLLSQVLLPVRPRWGRAVRGDDRGSRVGLLVGAAIVGAAVVAIVERGLHDSAAVAAAPDPIAVDRGDGVADGSGRAVPEAWTGEAAPGAPPGERAASAEIAESTPRATAGRARGVEPRRAATGPERARTREAVAGAAGARGEREAVKSGAPEAGGRDGATSEAAAPAPAQETSAPKEPSRSSAGAPASGRSLDQAIADAIGTPGTSSAGAVPGAAAAAPPQAQAAPAAGGAEPAGGPAASGPGAELDRAAAASALRPIASSLSSCKASPEDSGRGSVAVTFVPSGAVSVAVVDGPFAGTPTGACIARLFRTARVPPFTGAPVVVRRSFNVP